MCFIQVWWELSTAWHTGMFDLLTRMGSVLASAFNVVIYLFLGQFCEQCRCVFVYPWLIHPLSLFVFPLSCDRSHGWNRESLCGGGKMDSRGFRHFRSFHGKSKVSDSSERGGFNQEVRVVMVTHTHSKVCLLRASVKGFMLHSQGRINSKIVIFFKGLPHQLTAMINALLSFSLLI